VTSPGSNSAASNGPGSNGTASNTVVVTTPTGEKGDTIVLPEAIFGVQSNIPLMHQVVVAQLAAARQGTHKSKNRGEVSGGGKKPYRQKGTGRARQGSTRSPQFVGGGTSHGPVPHLYLQRTPKKMKAAALRGALSDRARSGNVHVLSALVEGDKPSTKVAIGALAAVSTAKNVLVVISREDEAGWKSLRNAGNVHLIAFDQLNTYDVLISDDVVFTQQSLNDFLTFARVHAVDTQQVAHEANVQGEVPVVDTVVGQQAPAQTSSGATRFAASSATADVLPADTELAADTDELEEEAK
jgi:large subunit ribosomal protein L4